LQKVLLNSVLILVMGCSQPVEEYTDTSSTNYDSLFNLGDSVLGDYYVSQAKQRMYHDSLNGKVSTYQIQLNEKRTFEAQQRRIYKDTIIYNTRTKTITDTVFKHVYLTDTIRDTIFVTKRELKRRRNGN